VALERTVAVLSGLMFNRAFLEFSSIRALMAAMLILVSFSFQFG